MDTAYSEDRDTENSTRREDSKNKKIPDDNFKICIKYRKDQGKPAKQTLGSHTSGGKLSKIHDFMLHIRRYVATVLTA